MNIGQKLKELRIKNNLSQDEVAKAIDSTKQAIYKYENGIVTNIPIDKISKMAQLFGVTPAYLTGWDNKDIDIFSIPGISPIKKKKLPLLGNIACGEPIFANEEFGEYIEVEGGITADFCLRAQGDSMINARIYDGDIVLVKKQSSVENGEIAVVLIGDEATLKRVFYYPEKQKLVLSPENPKYEPFVYIGEELNEIKILGKAVVFQSIVR